MTSIPADVERLMNDIRTRLPGAIDDAIKREYFVTMREFFDTANIWTEEVEFDTESGETEYEVTQTENSQIIRLERVLDQNDRPVAAVMDEPGTITLGFEPTSEETFIATLILNVDDPTDRDDFPQFPSWILKKYMEGIMDGILGRMMSQPAKPYANERLAIYHMRRFRVAMVKAKTEWRHGQLFGAQRWQFPRFT